MLSPTAYIRVVMTAEVTMTLGTGLTRCCVQGRITNTDSILETTDLCTGNTCTCVRIVAIDTSPFMSTLVGLN